MTPAEVAKYGFVLNDSGAPARAANKLAIERMLAAQSVAASSKAEEILLPKGLIYLDGGLTCLKAGIIRGHGGNGRNASTWLIFPAGVTGILAGNIEHGPSTTQATGLVLRDLAIASDYNGWHVSPGNYTSLWVPDEAPALNAIRNFSFLPVDDVNTIGGGYLTPHPGMCYGYAYKVVHTTGDGKCAATRDLEPEGENIYPLRTSAISATTGNGVNPIVVTSSIVKPNGLCVLTGHRLTTGMWVRISGVVGNTAANGIHQVTVTGTNTFTIPVAGNGAYISGGTVERVIKDDNVYWLPIEAHGIDVKSRVVIENVFVTGFPGNGINFNCSVNHPYYSNANISRVVGGDFEQNGGSGITIMAGDTALITLLGTNCNQNRAIGYDIKAGSACTIGPCAHGAINVMGDFRIWDSSALMCYSEGSYRPAVVYGTGNAQWIGGTPGGNQDLQFTGHYAAGADPVTWAAGQVVGLGKYVKPPVDNGYIYKVTQAGTLAAPPAFIPRGYSDLEIGGDFKEVTSNTAKLTPFAQSLLSIGEISVGTTRNSAKSFRNLIAGSKFDFHAGYTGETLGTTGYGPFGWAGPASVDGGATWSLDASVNYWEFVRGHSGTGGALRLYYGDRPVVAIPHGLELPNTVTGPAAPGSGYRLYFDNNSAGRARGTAGTVSLPIGNSTRILNAAYGILPSDKYVWVRGLAATPRTIKLPSLDDVPENYTVCVGDEDGSCNATGTLSVTRADADIAGGVTLNGGTTVTGTTAYVQWEFVACVTALKWRVSVKTAA